MSDPVQHEDSGSNDKIPISVDSVGNGSEEVLGRGMRSKNRSVLQQDYVTHNVVTESPSSTTTSPPQQPSGTPFPIAHYINCDIFSATHRKFLAAVIIGKEPRSFKEAMKDVGWKQAMQEEIKAFEDNGTWTLEYLPPGKRALGNQWVL